MQLTFPLSTVQSLPESLCGVARRTSSTGWTQGSKVLSLIDYLDQAVFEGLMQSDLISQANFVCVPLSEPPTSLLPLIRPGFAAKSTPWQLVEGRVLTYP